ncbi:hypothetical protein JW859_00580 [bacterium]|nr:hypothetical protein [bacterium]
MLKTRFVVLLLLALISLAACGGGTSGLIDDDLSADGTYMGISSGDFKAVRANDAGYRDSSLNATLSIQSVSLGDVTEVKIAVNDTDPMYGVTLDLNYDSSRYNPVDVQFAGLIDTPVELAVTTVNGVVGLGQVDVSGPAVRSGDFVTVTFANEPAAINKLASAVHTGDELEAVYGPTALTIDPCTAGVITAPATAGGDAAYVFHANFAIGDGNSDGESGTADLTPLVSHGHFNENQMISDTTLEVATADYNGDGLVTVNDITPLGQHFMEFTNGIELLIEDANDFTGATAAATLAWADSNAHTLPAPAGTSNWNAVFRTWEGTIAAADMMAVDVAGNGDGHVFVSARLVGPDNTGTPLPGVDCMTQAPPIDDWLITGITVQIDGATGGTGATNDYFADGDTADVVANSDVTLNITEIDGTFDGTPIDGTEADYATVLADIGARVTWVATNTGHADMESTGPVLDLAATTGTAVNGTVFPDDDLEADAEGNLVCNLAMVTNYIPGALSISIDIDVAADDTAPVIVDMSSDAGLEGDDVLVNSVGNTNLEIPFDFGTGGAPADLSTIPVSIYDLTDQQADIAPLTWSETPNAANMYNIRVNGNPESSHLATIILGSGNLSLGHMYMVRIMDGVYNSVNKPGFFLTPGGAPPTVEFMTLPPNVNQNTDYLWVFYPDPKLHANPRGTYNLISNTFEPENNAQFMDIVKTSGYQFVPENNGGLFPRVFMVDGATPSAISFNDPAAEAGIGYQIICPGYIVLDIAVLTTGGRPDATYGYRVFTGDGIPLGGGEVFIGQDPMAPSAAVGINWGINIFDNAGRGDLALGARAYDTFTFQGQDVNTGQPPCLFVEFGGGDIGDCQLPFNTSTNMLLRLHNDTYGDEDLLWEPCVALTAGGNQIAIHSFIPMDFRVPGSPGVGGNLEAGGEQFTLRLMNPAGTTIQHEFAQTLIITGTNPNDT